MAGSSKSSDNIKKIAAAGLGAAMVLVLVYQFFFSGPTPKPTLGTRNTNTPQAAKPAASQTPAAAAPATPQRALSASAIQDALMQTMLADTTPLNLAVLSHAIGASKPGERGSIFGFYIEPPKPPPPPQPPPPIVITGISPQSAVASAPKKVTVTVTGNKIPADAQVYYEGQAKPTKRLSETQLSIELEPGEYGMARSYNVEVKSPADPAHMNSNTIQFVAQAPPEPGVVFKARLGDLSDPQTSFAVFEVQATREIKRFRKGEMLQGAWRIDAINADSVDMTHTQYDIKRRIPLQDKPK